MQDDVCSAHKIRWNLSNHCHTHRYSCCLNFIFFRQYIILIPPRVLLTAHVLKEFTQLPCVSHSMFVQKLQLQVKSVMPHVTNLVISPKVLIFRHRNSVVSVVCCAVFISASGSACFSCKRRVFIFVQLLQLFLSLFVYRFMGLRWTKKVFQLPR